MAKTLIGIYLSEKTIEPRRVEFEAGIKSIQKYCEGYVDCVWSGNWGDKSILSKYDIYVDDEGIIKNKQPNIILNENCTDINNAGILFGPLLIVGANPKSGNMLSVKETDIPLILITLKEKMLRNEYR